MQANQSANDLFFQEVVFENQHEVNSALLARFTTLTGTDRVRQTHYLEGRFENSYIDAADIPEVAPILALAKEQAGHRLGMAPEALKAGFWFNAMGPGQRTLPHDHDEDDELLSGVYYIRVPNDSGELILHLARERIRIRPQEGKLVLFSPALVHEVTPNLSAELRLSMAINIGPADR